MNQYPNASFADISKKVKVKRNPAKLSTLHTYNYRSTITIGTVQNRSSNFSAEQRKTNILYYGIGWNRNLMNILDEKSTV
jgi:hypothetical protein